MKRTFLIIMAIAAIATFSSCTHTSSYGDYMFVNQTKEDCTVSFVVYEHHTEFADNGNSMTKSPIEVKAGDATLFMCGEQHQPSEVFESFTVTNQSGDTLYHSAPAKTEDWEFSAKAENVTQYHLVNNYRHTFTLK